MALTEDDRLWRDQNIPSVSDEELENIVNTFGVPQAQLSKKKKEPKQYKSLEQELTEKYHFKSMKDTKEIYYYDTNEGIYRNNASWLPRLLVH